MKRTLPLAAILTLFLLNGQVLAQSSADTGLTADALFQSTHVVEIQIELPKESWDEIRVQSRDFVQSLSRKEVVSPFNYVKGNVTIDGVLIEDVGIRKKGFLGSLDTNRPSLKIKFSEYKDQNPIDGIDRLTLNNNKQDPARYCQYLSYKLFRDSGTIAPRCNFARVTVNGNYLGIYSNVESVRQQFLERNFGKGQGELWEGTVSDFYPDWLDRFEEKNKEAQAAAEHLKKVAEVLGRDPVNLAEVEELFDVDAFIRYWAMESLIGFWDGYCSNQNNFFVYRNPENKKLYFIPWGTDASFSKTTPLPPYRIRPMSVHSQSILANKLYRIPEVRKKYEQTLMAFLDEHWVEETLLAEVDRVEELLTEHVHEDNAGFDRTNKKYREFVSWRRKALMREFRKGPPKLRSRERSPIYFDEVGTATISFKTKWYDRTPRKVAEIGEVEIDMTIRGEQVEFKEVGVYSERSKWPSEDKVKPASIVITGTTAKDDKKLTLGMGVPDAEFQPTGDNTVEIGGIFMVNNAFVDGQGKMTMVGGEVNLTAASTEDGEPVSGSMTVKIMKLKGGDPVVYEDDTDEE